MATIKVRVACANNTFHNFEIDDEIDGCQVDASNDNGVLKIVYLDKNNKPAIMVYNKNAWLMVETSYK